jgi:hypothetical protein
MRKFMYIFRPILLKGHKSHLFLIYTFKIYMLNGPCNNYSKININNNFCKFISCLD